MSLVFKQITKPPISDLLKNGEAWCLSFLFMYQAQKRGSWETWTGLPPKHTFLLVNEHVVHLSHAENSKTLYSDFVSLLIQWNLENLSLLLNSHNWISNTACDYCSELSREGAIEYHTSTVYFLLVAKIKFIFFSHSFDHFKWGNFFLLLQKSSNIVPVAKRNKLQC